jgi:molybdopterin synthase catalytic subunit
MAEEKLRQMAEEIRARWSAVDGIAIVQQIGRLSPGTLTICVACASAH